MVIPDDWHDASTVRADGERGDQLRDGVHDRAAPRLLGVTDGHSARILAAPGAARGEAWVVFSSQPKRGGRHGTLSWQSRLLHSVLQLRDASPGDVRAFVERFGPLQRNAEPVREPLERIRRALRSGRGAGSLWRERVSEYRDAGARAYAILEGAHCGSSRRQMDQGSALALARWTPARVEEEVAAGLASGVVNAQIAELMGLDEPLDLHARVAARIRTSPEEAVAAACDALNVWLREARIQVCASVRGRGRPTLDLFGATLNATIAFQVAAKAAERSYALCAGCHVLFQVVYKAAAGEKRQRAPQAGRRAYCQRCRRAGRPLEDADADRRARKRAGIAPRRPKKRR